jgi:acyl-CoA reductase-like NAD-dependent aldehyde dehydrogenase
MLLKKDLPPLELFSCSHVIGYGILCVDDAWKEALNIHFERLSSEEIKERMKEIVEKVEKRKDEIIRMRDLRAIKELEERLEEEIRRLFS